MIGWKGAKLGDKMDIFFCDIVGTFEGNQENRVYEVKEFIEKILKLVEIDQVNHIIFSFISSENMEIVKQCINEIKPYLNDQIKLGIQFSEEAIYFEGSVSEINMSGKLEQILYVTKKLEKVKNIYFADDSEINQKIISEVLKVKYPNFNIISFVPGTESKQFFYGNEQKGITGLNKIIDHYIHTKKPQTKPIVKQNIRRYS